MNAKTKLDDFYTAIVASELNVKDVTFKDDMESYLNYSFKPDFKVLGPKAGKKIGEIKAVLAGLDGHKAKDELDSTHKLVVMLKDGEFELQPEDIEVTMAQTDGFMAERHNGVTIALSTKLTPELIEEGFVNEIVSKIQTMRKDNGFEVMDHITVYVDGNDKLADIVKRNEEHIRTITLANVVVYGSTDGFSREWKINGETVTLAVK